jgi:putative transposase
VSSYRFIDAEKATYPVCMLCRVLGVSRSGYYGWKDRMPSRKVQQDEALASKIREIHQRSRETYGSPRVHAELQAIGLRCSRKRVARLMRESGIRGCRRGGRISATRRDKNAVPAEDLVGRDFVAAAPDRLWTADITCIATREGFMYLAFVLDAYSRRLVGWAMESHLRTELVTDALEMALWRRQPAPGLIHHSDRGVQYTAFSFGKRLQEAGAVASMGRVGSALDNAISESFVSTLKAELVSRVEFPTCQIAKTTLFEYLESFYNRQRLHSALGYRSPAYFEEVRLREAGAA